ncbi:redoxin domain-containing protein [Okeania sp.]|uniref:redoxin domain-containing protein n=1 Tax=Okeania sp. TaxID=3100323 RepID=UPI002B4B7D43|nr:redoxin domain-containing protein [Okeania sp.]MEB3341474.1 redoxin domain-containing protein [Okeania sp.]
MITSTTTLSVGDRAIYFALPDQSEKLLYSQDEAGKPAIIIFYASNEIAACQDIACAFRDLMPTFNKFDLRVYIITSDSPKVNQKFAEENNIPFPLLSDYDHKISRKYGVCFPGNKDSDNISYKRTGFLLDPNHRIVNIYHLKYLSSSIEAILKDIKNILPKEEPRHIQMQAPVLLIPNVFSLEYCNYLIDIWQTKGNKESGYMRQKGEKTIGYIDHTRKIRKDHFVRDEETIDSLNKIMNLRVFPEIKKAFNFDVTRQERYKIACYDGNLGGFFNAHRDNTTPGTKHRIFAMTLNLNAGEYEGGFLKFPEYGPHFYKPDTGSAVIFSCSLMHEATPVTSHFRFALLNFFYGDKESEARKNYEKKVQNDYSTVVRLNS